MDTVLSLSAVTSHPSISCIQLGSSGQLLLATKSAVYILTPELGVNIDTLSSVNTNLSALDSSKTINWFRTMIETDKILTHVWPVDSQEWAALTLGSIDNALRSVVCSPTHITMNAGSVIAALDSNLQLSLWTSPKNHLRGEWLKVLDVTGFLKDHFNAEIFSSATARTLALQVTSIGWSPQASFGIHPAPAVDGSLFTVFTRAGALNLLRYRDLDDGTASMQLVANTSISEKGINHCVWSPWLCTTPGSCVSQLACGLTDGSITLLEVTQTLVLTDPAPGFGPEYTINTSASIKESDSLNFDKRGLTALQWVTAPTKSPLLIFCKPGTVHLFCFESSSVAWHGLKTMRLQTQNTSTESSALYNASGIAYNTSHDALIVSLFDGSFHVIKNIYTEPEYVSDADSELTSRKLSSSARALFLKAEGRELTKADVNRVSGMISLDAGHTFAWIHEACRPSDFSYKHEAKHNSMFVVAEMTDVIRDEEFLALITQIINEATAASGKAPIYILLPVFLQLRKQERLTCILPRVLDILKANIVEDPGAALTKVDSWAGQFTPEMRQAFRNQLTTHLFGWDGLVSLRLKLAIADFCWKNLKNPELQTKCGTVAQTLLNSISCKVLQMILKFLTSVTSLLTPNDIPFAYRIIIQSSLPGHPPELSAQGQELADTIKATVLSQTEDQEQDSMFGSTNETCPACHSPIPLHDINTGICQKNHVWARCSITSFILATPKVRTCLGCTRKAFLPNAIDSLPQAARSWVVEELLHATRRCLFCGNKFVTII